MLLPHYRSFCCSTTSIVAGKKLLTTCPHPLRLGCYYQWKKNLTTTTAAASTSATSIRRESRCHLSTAQSSSSSLTSSNVYDKKVKIQSELLPLPYTSQPLGSPLPFDEHACSVSLPTWCSVVGYEEGDESVTSAMNCGYPRFVYHPYVLQLGQFFLDQYSNSNSTNSEDCLVLPTKEAAHRCQAFLQKALKEGVDPLDNAMLERPGADSKDTTTNTPGHDSYSKIRVVSLEGAGVHAVLFPAETAAGIEAKAYWQHTGELVSSRRAEHALKLLGQHFSKRVTCCPIEGTPTIFHPCNCNDDEKENDKNKSNSQSKETAATNSASGNSSSSYYSQLQERISGWTNVPPDHIFLLPSGMATMYKALRSSRRYQMEKYPLSRGGTSIVFGFPYLDTLKLCSRTEFSPAGVEFFGKGDQRDLELLERLLQQPRGGGRRSWSGLFTEVPSNPLLQCPDLDKLRELADAHDFCLIVDDTIGNFLNVDLIDSGLADAVCTSLTKIVSGRGDVIAGSVVANPNTEKGRWMKEDMAKDTDLHGGLFEADARAMVYNSRDFEERSAKINQTSEQLADFLNDHPDIETVWYPKFVAPLYHKYQRQRIGSGYGGLMSIHLHPHICQRTFYDALDVAKGPSLGTNFTLVCPYTLLAHYHELDFAMSYNVPPNLLRIAVGLEDFDELKTKFSEALSKSRLHPKLKKKIAQ